MPDVKVKSGESVFVMTYSSFKYIICLWLLLFVSIFPSDAIDRVHKAQWQAGIVLSDKVVQEIGLAHCFVAEKIPDEVFSRMQGKTWKDGSALKRDDYRYLRVLHRNADGMTQTGEMICNKMIADKLVKIFRQLYDAHYRIERMVLIDNYDADDERSMTANNTSCFNYRVVKGSKTLSRHALGLAVDINPLYNPYVKKGKRSTLIQPAAGRRYAFNRDRRKDISYKIDRNDLAYKLFTAQGFRWGGDWVSLKDYQHFEYK